jgi:hypothetical protein
MGTDHFVVAQLCFSRLPLRWQWGSKRINPLAALLWCLDISKAFNGVNLNLLLEKIAVTTLNLNVVRWLNAYLRGRMTVCLFQGAKSRHFKCHSDVPQGSVLSPHLFNFFVRDFPAISELNLRYADDFQLSESSPDLEVLGRKLTEHMTTISEWADKNKLTLSLEKSFVTLFTSSNREMNKCPQVFIKGVPIPVSTCPKYSGMTFDSMNTGSPHIDSAASKASKGL